MITVYGVLALSFMMLMYLFEKRSPSFVLAFAAGCALSSSYGCLSGAWPFGGVEAVWAVVRYVVGISPGPSFRAAHDSDGGPSLTTGGERIPW